MEAARFRTGSDTSTTFCWSKQVISPPGFKGRRDIYSASGQKKLLVTMSGDD